MVLIIYIDFMATLSPRMSTSCVGACLVCKCQQERGKPEYFRRPRPIAIATWALFLFCHAIVMMRSLLRINPDV